MKTYEFNLPKIGLGSISRDRAGAFLATVGEWEIFGSAWTLAAGLLVSVVATFAESFTR